MRNERDAFDWGIILILFSFAALMWFGLIAGALELSGHCEWLTTY